LLTERVRERERERERERKREREDEEGELKERAERTLWRHKDRKIGTKK
jgi:hypothetical protein